MRLLLSICVVTCVMAYGQSDSERIAEITKLRETNCDSALVLAETYDKNEFTGRELANLELEIAVTHYCLGNYDKALLGYQTALEIFREYDDFLKSGSILNLIGTLHKKQGRMDQGLEYFQLGLTESRDASDSLGIGNSLNNIGLVYLQTDRPEEALEYFIESTAVKAAIGDTVGLSYNYDNLGQTYSKLGDFEKAESYLVLASEYKKMIGEEVGYGIVRNNIGEMYLANGDAAKAEPFFLEALEIAGKVNYADFKQYILGKLSEVEEAQQNPTEALRYFKLHVTLKDSLFNERKSQQVAELETQYQTEKKEREIEQQAAQLDRNNLMLAGSGGLILVVILLAIQGRSRLKWKNRQLEEQQQRLIREAETHAVISSQEKERNRFARDLHDGFGQLISTLNLNLKSLGKSADKGDREKIFDASASVLEDMYRELKNICFDLMPQTLIKHGLEAALKEFADRVNVSGERHIEVDVFGLDERLADLHEISLYRISQEWANNVIKYSNAEKISIQITRDEDEITLMVEDDGLGFDKNLLQSGSGTGWKNISSRANLIHGELEIESSPGVKGSALILNAPFQAIISDKLKEGEEIPA